MAFPAAPTESGSAKLHFLANDGNGMFSLPESTLIPLGLGAASMLSGDFDGNKCPDLAGPGDDATGFAGGETQGRVFVLLGQGGGTFAPPVFYDVGQNPSDIAIGDLDGDGYPDLAISNKDDNTVSILVNLQDGSFAPRFTEDVGQAPSSLVIEDLNLDARPDIAVAADDLQIGPAVQVLENQLEAGDGGTIPFNNPIPFDVGGDPNFVASADFNSDGLPSTFNVKKLEILDFASGASDMNDASGSSKKITLDLGTVGVADGFTQFGAAFTPVFINQNGSRFGTFAGVTINTRGLVTALFDNGETRPIYQIPIATFVNVNGLESKTGNVWSATEGSGDVTLRVADNGPAGQIIQGALEASTVDIGEEFTKMIVVQRAFSASAKIISTTDSMLEELLRITR